jgi:hypothetical protein
MIFSRCFSSFTSIYNWSFWDYYNVDMRAMQLISLSRFTYSISEFKHDEDSYSSPEVESHYCVEKSII